MLRRHIGYTVALLTTLACSRDDTAAAGTRENRDSPGRVAPRPAVITPLPQPYRVVQVVGGGSVGGTVDFDGPIPSDTIIRPTSDQNVCGTQILQPRVSRSGTRIGGALVWLTNIRSGKGLPLERRFELTNDKCALDPFIQVVYTTSTLNVVTHDRALHTNRFINVGTGEVEAMAPFNDAGEVVPLDHVFDQAAQIEVLCEQHPWSRAWVAVLDHPYSAKTAANGSFNIPDVPAGRYQVRAWHPNLGFADDSITVVAGQSANVAFRIRRPGAPPTPRRVAPPPPAPVLPDSATASGTPAAVPATGSSTPPR
jgi:Polysaccharide lyase family 4, domain II